ncbi:hypothetical protein [Microbispora bryophytorum]|uniref:hypothetical protein n=1 Tax=Microbispora bryophytorum TaxID=1460882 RepID=UPI0014305420|nr:hypothetical protein [Microbispora bryophytorum]MBD3136985.1 hypothetical protein [Microbispora bryophytorum]
MRSALPSPSRTARPGTAVSGRSARSASTRATIVGSPSPIAARSQPASMTCCGSAVACTPPAMAGNPPASTAE